VVNGRGGRREGDGVVERAGLVRGCGGWGEKGRCVVRWGRAGGGEEKRVGELGGWKWRSGVLVPEWWGHRNRRLTVARL